MKLIPYPTIDLPATGRNIQALRQAKGYSVRDLQLYFGFQEPQAIYKWQRGECLPSVDNLFALSTLFGVPINDILIPNKKAKPQADACGFGRYWGLLATALYSVERFTPVSSSISFTVCWPA